ncbi:DUF378 domain-containing protein [Mesorhizobium sp. NPDC059054]|uniref:DUF378 domain-containing protein n=1 Tax=unclassified Mesorhizobium TaxID=325217 RepID=UPI0006C742A9|nr:DUF378 domain-containing protein [Mesorhizobium sp. 1M-11]
MRAMNLVTLVLIIIGGLNWLVMGAVGYDVLGTLFGGTGTPLARLVSVIIGLSAVWQLMPFVQAFSEGEVSAERHIRHH